MKKLIMFAACAMLAAYTQAAAVGWTLAGAQAFVGDSYAFFVVGQNGADSIATITALLDAGDASYASKAFGTGTIASNGTGNLLAANSDKELDAGTYEGFFVVFDSATPTAGSTKYAVVSGAANLTKTIAATTASTAFAAGNQATYLNNSANWASYGVPEPTSGLLMLVGLGALALRRKRA